MATDNNSGDMLREFKDFIRVFRKKMGLILGITIIITLLAGLYVYYTPPIYQARTTLRINQSQGIADSLFSKIQGAPSGIQQKMSTYAEILKSQTVIDAVIEKVYQGRNELPEYQEVLGRITTEPVKDTEILKVLVEDQIPNNAKLFADNLVTTFLERITILARSTQTVVRDFIEKRLEQAKNDLETAEQELKRYKQEQKIIDPNDETTALVNSFSQMDNLAAENKVNIATAKAQLENAEAQLKNEKIIAESPLISQHKAKLSDLEVKLVGLLEKYTTKHPDVLEVRAEIKQVEARLNEEISRIVSNEASSSDPIRQQLLQSKLQAEAKLKAALAQEAAIMQIQEGREAEIKGLPSKELGLVQLMRETSVAQETYVMLSKRFEEARITEMMQPIDVQVIDQAKVPRLPIKPKKVLTVVLAAILGIFLGSILAFILEYFDRRIANPDDVRKFLGLTVLGSIPSHCKRKKRKATVFENQLIVYKKPNSTISEAYRSLRTNIQFSKIDGELKTLAITSAGPGEGKSTTVANVAISLAQLGKRVIIVDCDLRNPMQHVLFGKKNQGLGDVLVESWGLTEVIQSTEIGNLSLLVSGRALPNTADILASKKMQEIITFLKVHYDYVIFDTPPTIAVTDACILGSRLDGMLLLISAQTGKPEMVQLAQELILKAKVPLLGAILTNVEIEKEYMYYYNYETRSRA